MADSWTLLQRRLRTNPGGPFVTHIDGSSGARTELSAASLANAAAKIGNALRAEFDLEPGGVVVLDLPVHWQRSAWCAGAWTAGCAVSLDPRDDAGLVVTSAGRATSAVSSSTSRVVIASLHPFGLPDHAPLPPGVDDATVIVRSQPDAYLFEGPDALTPAFVHGDAVVTQERMLDQAREWAQSWSLDEGGRLLAPEGLAEAPAYAAAFAVPLVAQGSVVLLSGGADEGAVAAAERTTALAT